MEARAKPRSSPEPGDLAAVFGRERGGLFALAYRLTGTAADAEDIVQETFVRALERTPVAADQSEGLRPWLVRVATNLGLDALRRRKRRRYAGPWLPSPIESASDSPGTDPLDALEGPDALEAIARDGADRTPEARYGLLESASFAFLLALEALGPRQRAVLLLRDVFEYSARETGEILGTSEGNVRILHLRARRSLETYEAERRPPTDGERERTRVALEQFFRCLAQQDARGLEALLADSVRTRTDAAGEYTALRAPLAGRSRVATFYLRAALHRQEADALVTIRLVNGLPAALIELGRPTRRQAPRTVLRCELDRDGRIREIHSILAPAKLTAIRFVRSGAPA